MDELNERITETRVALTRLEATVEAHEQRDTERHQAVLLALNDVREDHRTFIKDLSVKEDLRSERTTRIWLAVIGVLSTVAAGYFGVYAP